MLMYYEKVAPSRFIGKPLYTRPVRFTLSIAEEYSGVRGTPRQLITGEAVYSIVGRSYLILFKGFCLVSKNFNGIITSLLFIR